MKTFLMTLFFYQLSWCLAITSSAGASHKLLGNITEAYIKNCSRRIDTNVFERITHIIQAQVLPNNSVEQVQALIEPIREKFYDQVHSQATSELKSISFDKAECSLDVLCLGSEVPSLLLQVINSSLQEALSTISEGIGSLKNTGNLASPKSPTLEPKAPVTPPQNPVPPANTPVSDPPASQTPSATTESNGRPNFVSSIPADAPGAPKLPGRGKRHEQRTPPPPPPPGRPQAASFIPKLAQFDPVPDPSAPNPPPNPPKARKSPPPPPLPPIPKKTPKGPNPRIPLPNSLSQGLNNFGIRSVRRAISMDQHKKFWKKDSQGSFWNNGVIDQTGPTDQDESQPDQIQTKDLLSTVSNLQSPLHHHTLGTDQDISLDLLYSQQINLNNDLVDSKYYESFQEELDIVLLDFVKDLETRFEKDRDLISTVDVKKKN